MCVCLLSPVREDCPIDIYFTIDTSESIALQEPPPGSLVESIKVPWLCYSKNLKTMWPHSVVLLLLNDTQSCCMMLRCVIGLHKAVCAAFRRCRVQRCRAHQLEHWWTSLLSNSKSVQSHWTQDQFPFGEFKEINNSFMFLQWSWLSPLMSQYHIHLNIIPASQMTKPTHKANPSTIKL